MRFALWLQIALSTLDDESWIASVFVRYFCDLRLELNQDSILNHINVRSMVYPPVRVLGRIERMEGCQWMYAMMKMLKCLVEAKSSLSFIPFLESMKLYPLMPQRGTWTSLTRIGKEYI